MASATPSINGQSLEPHAGGFLPFDREITDLVRARENMLAVSVDSRWLNVPPAGSPKGPAAVDYSLPGGITGSVQLRAVPAIFLREVFAKPVDVLSTKSPRSTSLVASMPPAELPNSIRLTAKLRHGIHIVATVSQTASVEKADQEFQLTLTNLRQHPALGYRPSASLYDIDVTLSADDRPCIVTPRASASAKRVLRSTASI